MKNKIAIRIYRERNERLKMYGFKNYQEYLRSDRWKATKEKIKKRAAKSKFWSHCFCCDTTERLVPHHLKYKNNLHEKNSLHRIVMVCFRCHQEIHELAHGDIDISLKTATTKIRRKYLGKVPHHAAN